MNQTPSELERKGRHGVVLLLDMLRFYADVFVKALTETGQGSYLTTRVSAVVRVAVVGGEL